MASVHSARCGLASAGLFRRRCQPRARRGRRGGARGSSQRRGLCGARQLARARSRPRQPRARRAGAAARARVPGAACPSRRSPRARRRATCCAFCSRPRATRRRAPTAASQAWCRHEGVRPPAQAQTLVEALEYHVERQPERLTVFLYEGEREHRVSYRDLWEGALAYAARLAQQGCRPGPDGRDHAADVEGVPLLLLRHAARRRHSGAALSAGAARDHRGPHDAPCRRAEERGRLRHGHHPGSEAARVAAARSGRIAARRARAGRFPGRRARLRAGARPRRPHRVSAVHLGQHRQPEGRGADAREPARQRARDGEGRTRDAPKTSSSAGCRSITTWASSAAASPPCTAASRWC